jgi:hypothetical protein
MYNLFKLMTRRQPPPPQPPKKPPDYCVCSATSETALVNKVKDLMAADWVPTGGICVTRGEILFGSKAHPGNIIDGFTYFQSLYKVK